MAINYAKIFNDNYHDFVNLEEAEQQHKSQYCCNKFILTNILLTNYVLNFLIRMIIWTNDSNQSSQRNNNYNNNNNNTNNINGSDKDSIHFVGWIVNKRIVSVRNNHILNMKKTMIVHLIPINHIRVIQLIWVLWLCPLRLPFHPW
jgi:hypothetical protein